DPDLKANGASLFARALRKYLTLLFWRIRRRSGGVRATSHGQLLNHLAISGVRLRDTLRCCLFLGSWNRTRQLNCRIRNPDLNVGAAQGRFTLVRLVELSF